MIPVRIRDCTCPGTPHGEGDIVFLAPTLSLEGGLAAESELAEVITAGGEVNEISTAVAKRWLLSFVRYGAKSWNLTNGHANEPKPFDVQAILDDYGIARVVAEKANELYADAVLAPLRAQLPSPLPPGPTAEETSPAPSSTETPPEPLSPATTADTTPLTG